MSITSRPVREARHEIALRRGTEVCALAKHIGAPVTYVRVDLARGEHLKPPFRALNPNGKVPVLEDGDTVLWEADAIMCRLAMHVGSDVWPRDARQIEVMRWLSWNQAHFQPLVGKYYFERVIKPMFNIGTLDEALPAQTEKPLKRAAQVLDAHLADRAYLVDDQLTIADFSTAITLPYMQQAKPPFEDFPHILRWGERMDKLEAWREPFPAAAKAA